MISFPPFLRKRLCRGCQSFLRTPRDASGGFQSNLSEPWCFYRLECVSGLGGSTQVREQQNQQQLPGQQHLGHVRLTRLIPPRKRNRDEQAPGTLGGRGKLECCGAGKRLCRSSSPLAMAQEGWECLSCSFQAGSKKSEVREGGCQGNQGAVSQKVCGNLYLELNRANTPCTEEKKNK